MTTHSAGHEKVHQNELGQPVGRLTPVAEPTQPASTSMNGQFCRLLKLNPAAHSKPLYDAFAAAADDGDWTYLPYGPFEDEPSFMSWLESVADNDDPQFFAICDAADGRCSGLASYLRINSHAASIEVGHIHLSRSLQGTTAATEAMYLLMKRAFDAGYRRYEWKCDDLNAPSRAAALRLGFTYEGTFRQATHYKGRNRDTAWFSIVDSEWPDLAAEFDRWLRPDNFDGSGQQHSTLRCRSVGG